MPIKIAAYLMLFSGCSHPAQLIWYGTSDPNLVSSSLSGSLFLLVGWALLGGKRWSWWLGAILPGLFGVGATIRIITQEVTPWSYLHLLIDVVVVVLCLWQLLVAKHSDRQATTAINGPGG